MKESGIIVCDKSGIDLDDELSTKNLEGIGNESDIKSAKNREDVVNSFVAIPWRCRRDNLRI